MNRTALITGATSGMGLAIARRFATDGDTVFITGRHTDTVQRTSEELGARGIGP